MKIEEISINAIKPYERNPRRNDNAVNGVANSIAQFGFQQPIVIDKNGVIVAGHTRYKAALKLGFKTVPCVRADNLTPKQVKAYRILDNKLNELAEWDISVLGEELAKINTDFSDFGVVFPPIQIQDDIEFVNVKTTAPEQDITENSTPEHNNNDSEDQKEKRDSQGLSEWVNMPEIRNENVLAKYSDLIVVFKTIDRKIEMGKLLGININESTSYIYYPEQPEDDDTTKIGYR